MKKSSGKQVGAGGVVSVVVGNRHFSAQSGELTMLVTFWRLLNQHRVK